MNLGTLVVFVVLVAIVGAIVWSWVRARKQGRHIGCDECGGDCCSSGGCGCADMMVEHMDEALSKDATRNRK